MTFNLADAEPGAPPPVPLVAVSAAGLQSWLATQPDAVRAWIGATGFRAEPGTVALVPGPDGAIGQALFGVGEEPWALAALPARLPPGTYQLADAGASPALAALAWAMGTYAFTRYKTREAARTLPTLIWPPGCNRGHVARAVEATFLVRDLVNTPAADMGPGDLAAAARTLAERFAARCDVVAGDDLPRQGYPAIHAVGRASARAPCLIDLTWGERTAPAVTLVGKGVCFDSGGLDIKPAEAMKIMKKDMGGAAHVLALAGMVMGADLPVRLRVLVPAVDNAISGNAMRPLDVLSTRAGITVEVGNTDAEGRLVLADALAEASAGRPALLLDCATLTGAARSALGTDIPALFSNDDRLAADLLRHAAAEAEPLWRLPLHRPYRRLLDSKVADISSTGESPHAGAITAALFLEEFVGKGIPWAHLDLFAWSTAGGRPGRVDGGEALSLRTLYAVIAERFPRG